MKMAGKVNEFDVIIIGGGITGAGTARDCSLRGLKVLLLERHDIATGATGRNHGLLHSGARYAVTDRESAEECIRENMILRRIARHCVEETEGLFLTLPEGFDAVKFYDVALDAGVAYVAGEFFHPDRSGKNTMRLNFSFMSPERIKEGIRLLAELLYSRC